MEGQTDLVAPHLAPLPHQTDKLAHHLFGEGHAVVLPGDRQQAIADEKPNLQAVLDEPDILVAPAEKPLHLRSRGQGNPLSL